MAVSGRNSHAPAGTSIHENALYSELDLPTAEGRQGSSVASLRTNMNLWMPLGTIICRWLATAKHEGETLSSLAFRWQSSLKEDENNEEKPDASCL